MSNLLCGEQEVQDDSKEQRKRQNNHNSKWSIRPIVKLPIRDSPGVQKVHPKDLSHNRRQSCPNVQKFLINLKIHDVASL